MKKIFTLLVFGVLFLGQRVQAQNCDTLLHVSFNVQESRCMATGSISISVTGGSGNYNYRAVGPVSTPYTLSTTITGLSSGYYSVQIKDIVADCVKTVDSVYVSGTYSDPRFQLTKINVTCHGNDGSIQTTNTQFGRAPFLYTLVAPSVSHVGDTSSIGSFPHLTPGEYYVQLTDSCGGIQVRRITIENYYWWIDGTSVNKLGCDSAAVSVSLHDNNGKSNVADSVFQGFHYGVIKPNGDTLWKDTSAFHVFIGANTNLTILVKDPCGNIHTATWTMPSNLIPFVGYPVMGNLRCDSMNLSLTNFANITSPGICLYNSQDSLVRCDSSGVFNNLPYGDYCIKLHDACLDTTFVRCVSAYKPAPSVNANVSTYNFTCNEFSAAITGQQNMYNPTYTLIDSLGNDIDVNTTGQFDNLAYGQWCIRIENGCADTLMFRCFVRNRPMPQITGVSIGGYTCTTFNTQVNGNYLINPNYCIYDSAGHVVGCDSSGHFSNLDFGQYCIKAVTQCLDTSNVYCFTGAHPIPSAGAVSIGSLSCNAFTATVTGQTNLTNPQYCIYNSNDSLLSCNYTGVFTNLDYGSYCIKIKDACVDTTIIRCFSKSRPIPSAGTALNVLSSGCTTVNFQATIANMFSPNFCLYDSANAQVACNTTGIFNNVPFGQYCVKIHDGCTDTTITRCNTFSVVRGLTINVSRSCTLGKTDLRIQFNNSNGPYLVKVYNPADSVVYNTVTTSNPLSISLAGLSGGQQYVVEATNLCGLVDTAHITPLISSVSHTATVSAKCPTGLFLNGAGDLIAIAGTNLTGITPTVIKKNNLVFNASFSNVASDTFTFADMEPATYVIQYAITNCTTKVYDTITVSPYSYPTQNQSTLYQCDNSGFSLDAVVNGGIGPYNYQIIGSTPSSPSISTPTQTNPHFGINNGTTYSLIRLRTIDACGNATLSDVSVLPLQNFTITSTSLCFYQNIVLSVESVPAATYTWYWKTTPTDSTMVGSGANYHLPFFVPEQAGYYVCKINIANGCMIRLVQINMDGNCGGVVLPENVKLDGKHTGSGNLLNWTVPDGHGVKYYVLERRKGGVFESVQQINSRSVAPEQYQFRDLTAGAGLAEYRVVLVSETGARRYTNTVVLKSDGQLITVYPNPAKAVVNIVVSGTSASDYRIDITGSSGQVIYQQAMLSQISFVLHYQRAGSVPPGVYLVRITDLRTGTVTAQKLLLE